MSERAYAVGAGLRAFARDADAARAMRAGHFAQTLNAQLMDLIDLIQWPAMLVTIVASWLVASTEKGRRNAGFWVFLLSNLLWMVWAVNDAAYALLALQLALAVMNIRGASKTDAAPT